MDGPSELVDNLGRLTLFADFSRPELEALAHTVDEGVFAEGQRVLRQGLSGSAFFVILEGIRASCRSSTSSTRRELAAALELIASMRGGDL